MVGSLTGFGRGYAAAELPRSHTIHLGMCRKRAVISLVGNRETLHLGLSSGGDRAFPIGIEPRVANKPNILRGWTGQRRSDRFQPCEGRKADFSDLTIVVKRKPSQAANDDHVSRLHVR